MRGACFGKWNEAAVRVGRAARGQSATLRVGFTESVSWHGVVPESYRRFRQQQPDVELQLNPSSSSEQIEAVRSGRLDAGFVFNMPKTDRELEQLRVASYSIVLAALKGHPLKKLRRLRLRDLGDTPFIWFPRRESAAFYDRLMQECFRAGLKSPRIVQEGVNKATILSLVLQSSGCWIRQREFALATPEGVVLLPVMDLKLPLLLALVWRKDNSSPSGSGRLNRSKIEERQVHVTLR